MKIIKNSIKFVIAVILLYGLIFNISYYSHSTTHLECGKIVSHSTDEIIIKHGTRTELYLNVIFDTGISKSINVEPTTYFFHKNGERICFNVDNDTTIFTNILLGIGFVTGVLILINILVGIVWCIIWLFSQD